MDTDIDLRLEKSRRPRSDQERESKKKKVLTHLGKRLSSRSQSDYHHSCQ